MVPDVLQDCCETTLETLKVDGLVMAHEGGGENVLARSRLPSWLSVGVVVQAGMNSLLGKLLEILPGILLGILLGIFLVTWRTPAIKNEYYIPITHPLGNSPHAVS